MRAVRQTLLIALCAALLGGPLPLSVALASAGSASIVPITVAPGGPQLGINIRWVYRSETRATISSQIERTLRYVKSLGANSVAVVFDLFVDGPNANVVAAGPTTPPAADVGLLISAARRAHLFVLIRPSIDEVNPADPWRGRIEPSNRSRWFVSYDRAIAPYVHVAQLDGANEIAVSCELESLGSDAHWTSVVAPFVRQNFKGLLMMDTSWENPGMDPQPGMAWGIDAYRALSLSDSASVSQLTEGWNEWLTKLPLPEPLSETYLIEVGISALPDAYSQPWSTTLGAPVTPMIQARWFDAACNFFGQHHFRGLYFYSTNLVKGPQTEAVGGTPMNFQGAGNAAIATCFKHRWGRAD